MRFNVDYKVHVLKRIVKIFLTFFVLFPQIFLNNHQYTVFAGKIGVCKIFGLHVNSFGPVFSSHCFTV